MLTLTFTTVQVPVYTPDVVAVIELQSCWFDFWIAMMRPPIHEVIDFPILLKEPPIQPDIHPDDLPEDIARIHA